MPSVELDNLVRIGKLKREPPSAREQQGLLDSARARLVDSGQASLSFDSRFDLAYNASHSLALYALRRLGYRSDHRYLAFQALPHTTGLPPRCGGCWPRPMNGAISRNMRGIWSAMSACWPI